MNTTDSENNLRSRQMRINNEYTLLNEKILQMKSEQRRNLREKYQFSVDIHDSEDQKLKIRSIKQLEEIISTFSGDDNTDIIHWIYKYEVIADACCWSDLQKVVYCKRMLRGSARRYIRLLKCCFSWKQLKSCLQDEFYSLPEDYTRPIQYQFQINEFSREVEDPWIGRTKRSSALERFFQKKSNNSDNKFTLDNTTTLKQLKEDIAYYDSINMMNSLKLHDSRRTK